MPHWILRSEFHRISTIWINLFENFVKLFRTNPYDLITIFNGRFFAENSAICAANFCGIKVLYHESAGSPLTYTLEEFSPFSISRAKTSFQEIQKEHTSDEIRNLGCQWFEQRRHRNSLDIVRFQKNWESGDFSIPTTKKIATFFTTSDDEFQGLSEDWNFGKFRSQFEAASSFLTLMHKLGYYTIVRIHPNTQNKARSMTQQWMKLKFIDRVFSPISKIDSYELVKKSDLVVVAGSSIGIESAFLGVPTGSVGSCIYDGLEAILDFKEIQSAEEFFSKLDSFDPKSSHQKALIYGFWETYRTKRRTIVCPSNNSLFSEDRDVLKLFRVFLGLKRRVRKKINLLTSLISFEIGLVRSNSR